MSSPRPLLPFDEWKSLTPVDRTDESLKPREMTSAQFVEWAMGLDGPIVLDGPRYVGKTFLSNQLRGNAGLQVLTAGRSIKERKEVMGTDRPDRATHKTGSADFEDFDLSVAQSHLWMLDTIIQLGLQHVVLDRTLTSSVWFQHAVYERHWTLWQTLMARANATLVYLQPPCDTVHFRRCQERRQDWHALRIESIGYADIMRRVSSVVKLVPIAISVT